MNQSIINALNNVHRIDFLRKEDKANSSIDRPISIGYGQTNSQPYTVGLMLEWLNVKNGHKILDVGSGSGWTSALLGYLTGKNGLVVAVERIPELVKFGKENCQKLNIKNVTFFDSKDIFGWPELAPYDRILVSASINEIPKELTDQLSKNGKMVIPINNDIIVLSKNEDNSITQEIHSGFSFVPLIK